MTGKVGWASRRTPQQFPEVSCALGAAGSGTATAGSEWIQPPAVPGTFVNTGAMLVRYSNDPVPGNAASGHQLQCRCRYAISFLLGQNHGSVVDCIPTCVGPDNPPR